MTLYGNITSLMTSTNSNDWEKCWIAKIRDNVATHTNKCSPVLEFTILLNSTMQAISETLKQKALENHRYYLNFSLPVLDVIEVKLRSPILAHDGALEV